MSRSTILLILFIILIAGGAYLLAGRNTEVTPVRVEKAMLNEAKAE